jgi:hypothetical protein
MAKQLPNLQAEINTQLAALKKSNPELATALARIPRGDIVKMAKLRVEQIKATQNSPGGATPGRTLVTPMSARPGLPAPPGGGAAAAAPAAAAPVEVAGGVAGVVKKGLSRGTKIAGGVGAVAGILLPQFSVSPLTLPGRGGRARELAVKGFSQLGASTSSAALSEIVRQQELASRRQLVMQTYEPDMFNQVLNILANTGAPTAAVTSTERQIGSNVETALPARRPDKDVKFLLDQLLAEASGG